MFLSRDDNHYNTVSVSPDILIKAEKSADGTYTDEAKAAAKARAEGILAEFNSGDKTEDSFAELANKYSEDEGSNTNGGLYENIAKGQMVQEFNDFCFADHKAGDTGIVYGESSSYAGYHVMYFVGEGEQYSDYLAKNSLLTSDMNAWLEELTSSLRDLRRRRYPLCRQIKHVSHIRQTKMPPLIGGLFSEDRL
ncbi:MAG: peptidylprolyl isomerase [Oscillospiraceae bacterium]